MTGNVAIGFQNRIVIPVRVSIHASSTASAIPRALVIVGVIFKCIWTAINGTTETLTDRTAVIIGVTPIDGCNWKM
jgi:hypothetical protein